MKQLIVIACALLTSGCAIAESNLDSETMYIKASALTKLSASVEAAVRYDSPSEGITDEELLKLATEHDPSLLTPFAGLTLKVLTEDRHAIVLMCDQAQTRALLEDAGCTARMDKHSWEDQNKSCAFTLTPAETCSTPNH